MSPRWRLCDNTAEPTDQAEPRTAEPVLADITRQQRDSVPGGVRRQRGSGAFFCLCSDVSRLAMGPIFCSRVGYLKGHRSSFETVGLDGDGENISPQLRAPPVLFDLVLKINTGLLLYRGLMCRQPAATGTSTHSPCPVTAGQKHSGPDR